MYIHNIVICRLTDWRDWRDWRDRHMVGGFLFWGFFWGGGEEDLGCSV